ncbi:MAG: M20/M25/M40 family metallo-hydrolase [Proteobacteria bacterium]|nr:M20/M25/M40 family metallo-hydrolase [Pseudomonadota bacterium]NIS70551.1 M20/M25/M40 family metallo-hydrolase [Pseudomonadota bacterium]
MNERLVRSFMDLVRIDSESGNEQFFIAKLREIIEEDLGGRCEIDNYGNLLARIEAKDCTRKEHIVFSNHADTVKPGSGIDPILENDIIRSGGDTILGGDDKAGIAEVLEALRSVKRHPPIEWIVTREEELGLVGAKQFEVSRLKAKAGFLIDSNDIDTIIVGGPSHVLMDVEIKGKGAHAGMEPERGISAIQAASHSISRMKLGRLDHESTANVGTIEAGTVRNAIPEKALILAECRSLDHEKCVRQATAMTELFEEGAKAYGASAEIRMEMSYRSMRIPEDAPPVVIAKRAMERCGLKPKTRMITGGTDASIFNEKGIQMAILGMGTKREHTIEEHIHISDMEKAVEVLRVVLEELCQST